MKKFVLYIAIGVGLPGLMWAAQAAYAAENEVGQALEISPPVINLQANPGESVSTEILIRCVSRDTLLVTGQVNDFGAAGEDGTPKILLPDETGQTETSPYSLITWVSSLKSLLLKPQEVQKLSIVVKIPANAAPGGYYGVIRFTATAPEPKSTGVALSASLGTLLFIRVKGDSKEGMKIEEFAATKDNQPGWLFESAPIGFFERLKNTGNVHLQPAGLVTISDMFGNRVAGVAVNSPPRNILPDSIRKFEQTVDQGVIGDKFLFGRYTADLKITYGDSHQVVTSSVSFWVIPYKLIAVIIVLLVGGFFLIRMLLKRYNQRIISRSQGGGLRMRSKRK